jgi:hypothetical protein
MIQQMDHPDKVDNRDVWSLPSAAAKVRFQGPSTVWRCRTLHPKRTSAPGPLVCAFRGKADTVLAPQNVCSLIVVPWTDVNGRVLIELINLPFLRDGGGPAV